MEFFREVSQISSPQKAISFLESITEITPRIKNAIEFATEAHKNQKRQSGDPYITHPLLVSCIVAHFGGDEVMICAALLHDVVEDTEYTLEEVRSNYGDDVASLVDGLTKIVAIRAEELSPSHTNEKLVISALSFRKMLITSIKDVRVLIVKLCDRMHNMLTLEYMPKNKRLRISEETLVVYAPIAHRLGISTLKNELEDRSFYYIFPEVYRKIDKYFLDNKQTIRLKLNAFIQKVKKSIIQGGVPEGDFSVSSRIKRHYSIYLKMQRKGISIDEVLDLLAIRVIVKEPLDCYRVFGILHLAFKPIMSRFKDYIALPKENGYQTIHTTLFDNSAIFEVQIRTEDMHKSAEYGIAAHWKYKTGGNSQPSLDWLNKLQFKNDSVEEFYELVKNDLYSDDIVVFSPDGDDYSLPIGAVVLDFAYAVHTEVGNKAKEAYVNNQKTSLLTTLKSGDIVKIITAKETILRCSWIDAVKTSRAKSQLKANCALRIKEIEKKSAINIIATIFDKSANEIEQYVKDNELDEIIPRASRDIALLKDIKNRVKNSYQKEAGFLTQLKFRILKLKELHFDNIVLHTNHTISQAVFDYCCHPKFGDDIVALKVGTKAFIHHRMCDRAYLEIQKGVKMLYVGWLGDKIQTYKLIVALENRKGILANFLQFLAKNDINVLSIELGSQKNTYATHCEIKFECMSLGLKEIKQILSNQYKIIDIHALKDAYAN
ncbi:RelA/SpoT family protein [Helicobacter ibis]|uniref:RelA/SpoT family protein n=1 Tax=Helicobacter ibis TaxID=2962633 RepID=A0ABT4VCJ4_9HELI|nr:RelA/SpoT family protein [Helicobacter ibis]MDA3968413.1 RelA/SpoT family protein [Helicobacter ibis]